MTTTTTTKNFIDLGWWTVPLGKSIKRLEDGSKTIPKFESGWKEKYKAEKNTTVAKLAGVLTGKSSGIIAIDCDNSSTYNLFKSLDPKYKFHFVSTLPKIGGTIIYKYYDMEKFSLANDVFKLDFYSDDGFIYLPGELNGSKEKFNQKHLATLKEAPEEVITLLKGLCLSKKLVSKSQLNGNDVGTKHKNYLAPKVRAMVATQKFLPELFSVITPKSFRKEQQYLDFGYLHPKNIALGCGSEYLSKVSSILGKDSSINEDLYLEAMNFINNLWEKPIGTKILEQTILEPMVSGSAKIDDFSIWKFDKLWEDNNLSLITKSGEDLALFFDDAKGLYYIVNNTSDIAKIFDRSQSLGNYLSPTLVKMPKLQKLVDQCPLVRTVESPKEEYGFYQKDSYTKMFNLFHRTEALAVLGEPKNYKKYKYPSATLNYFESLIPDMQVRDFLLSFLRTKLTTFGYSPIILYFLGISGSGKDTFVNLLSEIVGDRAIVRPSGKEFVGGYNGWIVGSQFAQLDEYGDQLRTIRDRDVALGIIKAYTGKPAVQIRQMRTDGYNYMHSVTFVMTANVSPLSIEANDRRVLYIDTPNKLDEELWVKEIGGVSVAVDEILAEATDFCYYLATQVKSLTPSQYQKPIETEAKMEAMLEDAPAAQKIQLFLKRGLVEELVEIAKDAFLRPEVIADIQEGVIWYSDLSDMYAHLTDSKGNMRTMTKQLSKAGIQKVSTTKNGKKAYKYCFNIMSPKECKARRIERKSYRDIK